MSKQDRERSSASIVARMFDAGARVARHNLFLCVRHLGTGEAGVRRHREDGRESMRDRA